MMMRHDGGHDPEPAAAGGEVAKRGARDPADELDRERSARREAEAVAHRLAAELERAREDERAARASADAAVRARDQFIAMVSHDLRGPIGTVLTWAQLLRGGLLGEEKRQRALDAIERGARAQVRLLESLVDLARLRAGTLSFNDTATDLAAVARIAVERSAAAAQAKGVALEVAESREALPLHGDPERLAQAVGHLVDNAVRATPEGGCVVVSARRDGDALELEVRDRGAGLEPGRAEALLAAARDLESAEGRRGLGLPLVVGLVERYGGIVELRSGGAGDGTTAVVRLHALA
jgi:signal transduction histidine kinase